MTGDAVEVVVASGADVAVEVTVVASHHVAEGAAVEVASGEAEETAEVRVVAEAEGVVSGEESRPSLSLTGIWVCSSREERKMLW